MKWRSKIITLFLVATIVSVGFEVKQARALGQGVISIAFDDGNQSQYDYAYPLMQSRGVLGTFYVVTNDISDFSGENSVMSIAELQDLQSNGNEIASHSNTHPNLEDLTDQQIRDECSISKQILQSNGLTVNNFAYPYGIHNDHIDSIVLQYYRSARSAYEDPYQMPLPPSSPILTGWPGETGDSSALGNDEYMVDQAYSTNSWTIIFFHSVIPGVYDDPFTISTEDFASFLDYVQASGVSILTVDQALDLAGPSLSASIMPTSVNMNLGGSQLFTSTVTGGVPPYTYQWYLNSSLVTAAASPTWTTKADLPVARADLPGVTYDNKLYVFGGYQDSGSGGQSEVYAYDPSTDSWTQKTSMNYARWGSPAALYNGVAYVFGGDDGASNNIVEAYDFATDSWVTKNDLPDNLAGQGQMTVTVGSRIYLFSTTYAYSYNPSTNSYTQLASSPVSKRWGTCAYVSVGGENRIYIMGGADDSTDSVTDTVYYYRPAYNDWTYAGTTPYPAYGTLRDNPVINGLIYFGFGHANAPFFSDLFSYDPNADAWSNPLPQGTYARDGLACGVINGKLYAVGGRNSLSVPILGLNYNEQFDPAVSGATGSTWTFTPTSTGTYKIYLQVTDSYADTAQSNTATARVTPPLTVTINPTQARIALGQSQTFTSSVSGGATPYTYQWVLNNTVVSGATSSTWAFKPTQTGHYNVYLNATDSLNNKAQSNTVTDILVYNQLTALISPTSADITLGGSQQFTSAVTGGVSPYTYQWYLNSSRVPGATSSAWTFTPSSAGTYLVYLNVTDNINNSGQSSDATVEVTSLTITISPTHVQLYYGQSQTFSCDVTGGTPPYTYQWVLNDTAVPGATAATWMFTPRTNGNYNLYLNVTDSLNNKAQSNIVTDINVYSVNLLLTAGVDQPACATHQPVTFTVDVFNELNPSLESTLTLTVTGPRWLLFL